MNPSLKLLVAFQVGLGALMVGGASIMGYPHLAASIAIGAGVMLANLLFLGWVWGRLFAKKSIAWTSILIVIKYAVLLGSIFFLVQTDWFNPLGAGLGIASFTLAALGYAAVYYTKEKFHFG